MADRPGQPVRPAQAGHAVGDLAAIRRGSAPAGAGAAGDVGAGQLADLEPMGLYVHFPFCSVHCPYCDFAVDPRAAGAIPHDAYADAVVAEIRARTAWFRRGSGAAAQPPRLASIYFGGGTPGLWAPPAIGRVIRGARDALGGVDAALEITVEANPGEVDEAGLRALAGAGVNRLSLGLQALDDGLLQTLGRNHRAAAGPAAVAAARAAGVANLSVDLMFGLPGQSADDWRRSVDGVVALAPDHVSAYALTIERGTPFGALARRGDLALPDDEQVAGMQVWARDALAAAGLAQYEVSSYAQPGRRAVHNALYWSGHPYLGVGASAASFRPLAGGDGWRFSNPRATESYLRRARAGGGSPAPASIEHRRREDLENEMVWLALRTADGLDRAAHRARFGADPVGARADAIERCVQRGWLIVDDARIAPTPAGLLFADEIAARLWL